MAVGTVTLARRGKVAIVTLSREERRNALDEGMWRALDAVLEELRRDLPRAVVITGAGTKAFCAGMDVNPDNPQIGRLVGAVQAGDRAPVAALLGELRRSLDALATLPVPVIAALNGLAFGGGAELALRCDLRVADPAATICFSEVRLGLMPDLGGGVALTRCVGPSVAADLALTARRVGAQEALGLRLVNRVSAPGNVLEEAVALGEQIAANGPRAVRATLAVIRATPDLAEADALALELESAIGLIAGGECSHGIGAFLSREPPVFPDP